MNKRKQKWTSQERREHGENKKLRVREGRRAKQDKRI